ncbi:unnamed protein product [Moneuplotes crassus]|uniref:Arrestin C-terminal-like domain-containing protein n=1 Tax=Euplotes crassus TaxID=5936 RepID=A0AAD1UK75_EUPCR|nr:unnamed protein product [Moneuplotes crassus]
MGNINNTPKFEHGDIYLQLDRPYCTSGKEMTGTIHLNLTQPFPGASLDIIIEGIERVYWRCNRTSRRHIEKNELIHQLFTIHTFRNGIVNPGQYSFPFNLVIPPNLSATCFRISSKLPDATILYSIKAKLEPNPEYKIKEMSFKSELLMRDPIYGIKENIQSELQETIPGCLCSCSSNPIKFSVQLEKDWYYSDETLVVKWSIDNSQSQKRVANVEVKLRQRFHLKDKADYRDNTEFIKYSELFEGIGAGQSTGEYSRHAEIDLSQISGFPEKEGIEDAKNNSGGQLQPLQPTTHSELIHIEYLLFVRPVFNSAFTHLPFCILEVKIRDREIDQYTMIQPPEGWNPVLINEVQLGVPVGGNERIEEDLNLIERDDESEEAPIHEPAPARSHDEEDEARIPLLLQNH